ncbi:MAG: FUSC family protein [Candidatus Tokpelaia sp.]|nr:MAG: FUSC family protein [Candidatus Tokpelaia sp.]KAA6206747.1 MAG: FUSC family protein [Candidatus Tokpelaia sp.]
MINLSSVKAYLQQALLQVKASWGDTLCGGLAAALAWFVSQDLFGHTNPLFASMAALVCLSPGLANHGKQAFYLLIGVSTGVLVGEFAMLFPPVPVFIRIGLVAFIASLLAASYAIVPVLIIQSGMAAIMVFAMGPQVAGFSRLADVALGAGIGLVFSQVLFTPNPLKSLSVSAELLFHDLAGIFDMAAAALESRDMALARQALHNCSRVHGALITLVGNVNAAQENTLWSLRGFISSRQVNSLGEHYKRAAIRLYASSLLLCEALLAGLKKQHSEAAPAWFATSLTINAENCRLLAGEIKDGNFIRQERSHRGEVPLGWADCANSLQLVENTLARFYKSKSRRSRLEAFHKRRLIHAARQKMQAGKTGQA